MRSRSSPLSTCGEKWAVLKRECSWMFQPCEQAMRGCQRWKHGWSAILEVSRSEVIGRETRDEIRDGSCSYDPVEISSGSEVDEGSRLSIGNDRLSSTAISACVELTRRVRFACRRRFVCTDGHAVFGSYTFTWMDEVCRIVALGLVKAWTVKTVIPWRIRRGEEAAYVCFGEPRF